MHGLHGFSEKQDISRYIAENNIKILNLCHIPEDGRLKTLSFSAVDKARVEEVLTYGERVDGSNLFSFIGPSKSDIFIRPRIDKVFVNPFASVPTLNVLSNYLDADGKPLDVAPQNVLARAEQKLRSTSGIVLNGLAELEFYVIGKLESGILFPSSPDRNYHESAPFSRFEDLRNEALAVLATAGVACKYAHSEVGHIIDDDRFVEQHEVEFKAESLAEMAENVPIAKWVLRNLCSRFGISVSFSPKISLQHIGTGMHVHLCGIKDGRNVVAKVDGSLSDEALCMMGGILKFASSLAAFGNPSPVSYLRFIASKESPMNVSWSYRNRLALIRVPLWWNPREAQSATGGCRETFEYRASDAFANPHLLLAALTVAANYGLTSSAEALRIANDLRVDESKDKSKKFRALPRSCYESAMSLKEDRRLYEVDNVFPARLVDKTIENLQTYEDRDLWKKLSDKPTELEKMLEQYLHCC